VQFPYEEFRNTKTWTSVSDAVVELEKNNDLHINTNLDYVVGFICKVLESKKKSTKPKDSNVLVTVDTKKHYFLSADHFRDNQNGIDLLENKYFEQLNEFLENYKTKNDFSHYTKFLNGFLALETLFSLLCSVAQAPYYFYGWLLKYRTNELYTMVEKISSGVAFPNPHKLEKISWRELSEIIHPDVDGEDRTALRNDFALVWKRLAEEYLTKEFQEAYNSIKHGLRARPDGVVEMKLGDHVLEGSDFGFRFGVVEVVGEVEMIRHKIVNYNREIFELLFDFVDMTIFNIKNYLKAVNFKGKVSVEQYQLKPEVVAKFVSIERPGLISVVFDSGSLRKET
jgi:hypothetical protein